MLNPPSNVIGNTFNQYDLPQDGSWAVKKLDGLYKIGELFEDHMEAYATTAESTRKSNTDRNIALLVQMEANDSNKVSSKGLHTSKCCVATVAVVSIATFAIAWTTVSRYMWY